MSMFSSMAYEKKISLRLAARERFLDFVRRHRNVHASALFLEQHENA
jgi:hypothetical protein